MRSPILATRWAGGNAIRSSSRPPVSTRKHCSTCSATRTAINYVSWNDSEAVQAPLHDHLHAPFAGRRGHLRDVQRKRKRLRAHCDGASEMSAPARRRRTVAELPDAGRAAHEGRQAQTRRASASALDGHPDLSGVWMHELTSVTEIGRLFGPTIDDEIKVNAPGWRSARSTNTR